MIKADFLKVTNALRSISEQCHKLFQLGIDITESPLVNDAESIALTFLSSHYNSDGMDWIQWWLYEKLDNQSLQAFDEEGNEIVRTIDELYEYVESNCKHV